MPSGDIIIISSDDDERHAPRVKRSAPARQGSRRPTPGPAPAPAAKKARLTPPVTIVSKTSPLPPAQSAQAPASQVIDVDNEILAELSRLRAENKRLQAQMVEAQKQPSTLNTDALKADHEKKFATEMLDDLTCEVCTEVLWTPYLVSCGHAFCSGCLTTWFLRERQNHENDPNANRDPMLAILPPHLRQRMDRPKYQCPSCRAPVPMVPSEDYPLKSQVRRLAKAAGLRVPYDHDDGGQERRRRGEGPFDIFFLEAADQRDGRGLTIAHLLRG